MLSDRVWLSSAEARVEEIKGGSGGVLDLVQKDLARDTHRTQVSRSDASMYGIPWWTWPKDLVWSEGGGEFSYEQDTPVARRSRDSSRREPWQDSLVPATSARIPRLEESATP